MTTRRRSKVDLVVPTVHLNGTSKDTLMDNLCLVRDGLELVKADLKKAAPNGRDYYLTPGQLDLAVAQHMRRMKTIDDLVDELDDEICAIDEQGN